MSLLNLLVYGPRSVQSQIEVNWGDIQVTYRDDQRNLDQVQKGVAPSSLQDSFAPLPEHWVGFVDGWIGISSKSLQKAQELWNQLYTNAQLVCGGFCAIGAATLLLRYGQRLSSQATFITVVACAALAVYTQYRARQALLCAHQTVEDNTHIHFFRSYITALGLDDSIGFNKLPFALQIRASDFLTHNEREQLLMDYARRTIARGWQLFPKETDWLSKFTPIICWRIDSEPTTLETNFYQLEEFIRNKKTKIPTENEAQSIYSEGDTHIELTKTMLAAIQSSSSTTEAEQDEQFKKLFTGRLTEAKIYDPELIEQQHLAAIRYTLWDFLKAIQPNMDISFTFENMYKGHLHCLMVQDRLRKIIRAGESEVGSEDFISWVQKKFIEIGDEDCRDFLLETLQKMERNV